MTDFGIFQMINRSTNRETPKANPSQSDLIHLLCVPSSVSDTQLKYMYIYISKFQITKIILCSQKHFSFFHYLTIQIFRKNLTHKFDLLAFSNKFGAFQSNIDHSESIIFEGKKKKSSTIINFLNIIMVFNCNSPSICLQGHQSKVNFKLVLKNQ